MQLKFDVSIDTAIDAAIKELDEQMAGKEYAKKGSINWKIYEVCRRTREHLEAAKTAYHVSLDDESWLTYQD